MFPCPLFLGCLAARDFAAWGVSQMTPELAGRFRTFFAMLVGCALVIGGLGAMEIWRQSFRAAVQQSPPWVPALKALKPDAVVLTSDVPAVAWWSDRRAVICPVGSRADMATVIAFYRPDYYLALDPEERGVAFRDTDLSLIDQGPGWKLYRITGAFAGRSTRQTNTLASWIVTFGSPTRADRSLTTSPVTTPL